MAKELKWRAQRFEGTVRRLLDLLVKQNFDSLGDITSIKEDALQEMKAADETIKSFNNYLTNQAEALDRMSEKLDDLEKEIKETNREMNRIKYEIAYGKKPAAVVKAD